MMGKALANPPQLLNRPGPGPLTASSEANLSWFQGETSALSETPKTLKTKAQDFTEAIISIRRKTTGPVKCGSCIIYPGI